MVVSTVLVKRLDIIDVKMQIGCSEHHRGPFLQIELPKSAAEEINEFP